jgi:hypothetical protein
MKQDLQQWEKDIKTRQDCEDVLKTSCPGATLPGGDLPQVRFYPVVIGFDAIEDKDERGVFKNLPTTFKLPAGSVDRLRAVGAQLLTASPDYQRLLKDLK